MSVTPLPIMCHDTNVNIFYNNFEIARHNSENKCHLKIEFCMSSLL